MLTHTHTHTHTHAQICVFIRNRHIPTDTLYTGICALELGSEDIYEKV